MDWKKLGQIYCATGESELMVSGGRAPVARKISKSKYEIYFASYDNKGSGSIFRLSIDIMNPTKILDLDATPILTKSQVGYFDDNGIIPSWVVEWDEKVFLYTIGFSLKNKVIFDAASGLAISNDGGETFDRLKGPVLDRGIDDPCFAASPCVLYDGAMFKMWFVSCERWEQNEDGSYKHFYNIKYKESADGVIWDQRSKTCIDFENEFEYAISRPSVLKFGPNEYRMWYSFRAQEKIDTYRIGYAESRDGTTWDRKDDSMKAFDVSEEGWDSEMLCYPFVFEHEDRLFMLYNGSGYGKTGFGIAELVN